MILGLTQPPLGRLESGLSYETFKKKIDPGYLNFRCLLSRRTSCAQVNRAYYSPLCGLTIPRREIKSHCVIKSLICES